MSLQIVTAGAKPVGGTFDLVVAVKDGAGALLTGQAVTARIYRVSTGLWWDATDEAWEGASVDNTVAETAFPGIYSVNLDSLAANAASAVVVVSCAGHEDAVAEVDFQHSSATLPITDEAAPAAITTSGQLFNLLAAWFGNKVVMDDAQKRVIVYQSDAVTPAIEFNSFDAAGRPSVAEPFIRERV
jgi:hypothetical protein